MKPTQPGVYKVKWADGSHERTVWVVRRGRGLSVNPGDGWAPTPMSKIGDDEFIWETAQ
jgi:hypothetical protein